MGEPTRGNARVPRAETIGARGARGELKHLSTLRKRKDSPSSGERKGRSPNRSREEGCSRCDEGVVSAGGASTRAHRGRMTFRGRALEGLTIGGESPVPERGQPPAGRLEYHGAR